ncbi:polysaccharide biosynthesis tyrosine autokinase [Halocynthiibacter namhaensis]|uniref:polysaccharide biosynthesis tyrosine autokinase n=1 Tax=Halocynthiibacter namhaensis TaxID=1290553 RepID=UPI00069187BC|nr:polysaccharide biosynthesis tyrosine autokinase [Halocynthiibacter namhaensis]
MTEPSLNRHFGHHHIPADTINILALPSAMWRGKWTIFWLTAIFCGVGGYFAFVASSPIFRARADIILETRLEQVVDIESVVSGLSNDSAIVNSEVEVLRARDLMKQVTQQLDLMRDAEFNESLRPDGLYKRLKNALGLDPAPSPSERQILSKTVDALISKTHVRNIPFSLVFTVVVETYNPEKSALIADTIVQVYIQNQLDAKNEAMRQATSWLSGRVSELQVALENSERQINTFSSNTDLISQESLHALERQLKDQRLRYGDAQSDAEAQAQFVQSLRDTDDPSLLTALANDRDLEALFRAWMSTDDPQAQTAFQQAATQFIQRAELNASRLQAQAETLRIAMANLADRISKQNQDLIRLQQLTREGDANRILYEHFLTRFKETSAQQGIQQADSRVLSKAMVPTSPATPRRGLILALALVMGLAAGVTVVALRQMISPRIRSARDIEDATGYSVLGEIPKIADGTTAAVLNYLDKKPMSSAAEAIRNLRTSLMLSNPDNPPQIILSTSAIPGEGKTTTTLALAQNFAQSGKKVLLIEGDIRRGVLNKFLQIPNTSGIADVLIDGKPLRNATYHVETSGIDILTGDTSRVNAADLFGSSKFGDLLDTARASWDTILIDSPPVLAVPDARVLGQHADTILFTVRWDKTTSAQIKSGLRLFEMVNLKPTGFVLNQISPAGLRDFAYGGRMGQHLGYYDN